MVKDGHSVSLSLRTVAALSWRMLTDKERLRVGFLALGMAVDGVLQSFSLAAMLPVIGLIADPTAVQGDGYLASLSRFFGDPDPRRLLIWFSVGVLATIVLKNAFHFIYVSSLNRLVARVEKRVAVGLLEKCMMAPYMWFLAKNSALLVKQVMGDVVIWARSGLKSVLSLSSSAVTMVSIVILLVGINPLVGSALVLAGGLFNLAVIKLLRPYIHKMAVLKHIASNEAYKIVNHALVGAKDIKVNGSEEFFVGQFAKQYQVYVSNAAKPATLQAIPGYIIEIAVALVVVMIGIHMASQTALRSEFVVLVAIYGVGVIRLLPVFNQISATVNSTQGAVPAIETIMRMQSELVVFGPSSPGQNPEEVAIRTWDRLEVQDITYAYPDCQGYALEGVTLAIERGLRVGIVGRSGSGKTTLVDILTGLLRPTSGRVTIGGHELSTSNAPAWRKQIGYVPQHPFIADESLRFNIALGVDPKLIDDKKVLQALETANFGDVLRQELLGGLDTVLGERGQRLSGGQRQRVAIARALYRDPSLLVLDEATSALDSESERAISTALSQISREKTILIVAHRLSTVKDCDKIVVLDKGKIVGYGSHLHLIQDCPLYRRFVELGDLSLVETGSNWAPHVV